MRLIKRKNYTYSPRKTEYTIQTMLLRLHNRHNEENNKCREKRLRKYNNKKRAKKREHGELYRVQIQICGYNNQHTEDHDYHPVVKRKQHKRITATHAMLFITKRSDLIEPLLDKIENVLSNNNSQKPIYIHTQRNKTIFRSIKMRPHAKAYNDEEIPIKQGK